MDIELNDKTKITIEKTETKMQDNAKGLYVAYSPDGKDIGCLRYKVENNIATINFLTISEKQFLGKGVGHSLLQTFEDDMKAEHIKRIQGVYCPIGAGSSRTKQFYEAHGYTFKRNAKTNDLLVVKVIEKRSHKKKIKSVEENQKIAWLKNALKQHLMYFFINFYIKNFYLKTGFYK